MIPSTMDHRPHHPRCPSNPVDADLTRVPECRCDDLETEDFNREMENRLEGEEEDR